MTKTSLIVGLCSLFVGAACSQSPTKEPGSSSPKALSSNQSMVGRNLHQKFEEKRKMSPEEKEQRKAAVLAQLEAIRAERQGDDAAKERLKKLKEHGHKVALEKYDANGDGVLDPEERSTMRAKNAEFLGQLRANVLARYDVNQNGKIDPEERQAIRADAHQPKPPKP